MVIQIILQDVAVFRSRLMVLEGKQYCHGVQDNVNIGCSISPSTVDGLRADEIFKGRRKEPLAFSIGLLGYHCHSGRVVAAGGHGAQTMGTGAAIGKILEQELNARLQL